jgi:hypothetical protein
MLLRDLGVRHLDFLSLLKNKADHCNRNNCHQFGGSFLKGI